MQNFNDVALRATSLPSDAAGRSSVLASLWSQVFTPSVQSVQHCRNLYELLVRHRASLTHSSNLLVAPPTTLTQAQLTAQAGPITAVLNLSARDYNPAARRRVSTARAKDPSCYSVHKTAGNGQQVTCLCGVGHINDHKVRRLYSCLLLHVISFNLFRLRTSIAKQRNTKRGWKHKRPVYMQLLPFQQPVYQLQC